ncbi:MAG: glycosyltransferase family 9 protein [Candidatus Sericytochromatia bacterium]|nr:glycosyltransferase family 9 protein [Candidatus Sericytochromatia bacterium]
MISEDSLTRDFKKILLICFGGIGDVILFYPVINVLRDLYPRSKIIFVVEPRCKNIAEKNPYVNQVITFDLKNKPELKDYVNFIKQLRQENLDLAVSIGRSPLVPVLLFLSGAKHRVGYATNPLKFLYSKAVPLNPNQYAGKMYFDLLKGVGIDADILSPVPVIKVPDNEKKWADQWFADKNLVSQGLQKIIMIHPGASNISKQKNIIKTWDPEKWSKLINQLLMKNIKVILAGGPDDSEDIQKIKNNLIDQNNNFIDAYGQTKSLEQLAALIQKSDMLVCVDSAPLNMAVGVGTPLVAIFGPTNENKILPKDNKFKAVRINLDCTPCLWEKRQNTCEALTCLTNLDVNTVLETVLRQLEVTAKVKC